MKTIRGALKVHEGSWQVDGSVLEVVSVILGCC